MKRAENFKASFFRTLALKTTVGFERNIFLDHSLADVHPPKDITSNPVIPTSNEASPSKFRVRVCFSSFSLSLSLSLSLPQTARDVQLRVSFSFDSRAAPMLVRDTACAHSSRTKDTSRCSRRANDGIRLGTSFFSFHDRRNRNTWSFVCRWIRSVVCELASLFKPQPATLSFHVT